MGQFCWCVCVWFIVRPWPGECRTLARDTVIVFSSNTPEAPQSGHHPPGCGPPHPPSDTRRERCKHRSIPAPANNYCPIPSSMMFSAPSLTLVVECRLRLQVQISWPISWFESNSNYADLKSSRTQLWCCILLELIFKNNKLHEA